MTVHKPAASPEQGVWGTFLAAAKTTCFEDPPCFSPAQHWLPTYAFLWWNGILYLGQADKLPYSCLENPMDQGACWATIHGLAKSRTGLKQLSTTSFKTR